MPFSTSAPTRGGCPVRVRHFQADALRRPVRKPGRRHTGGFENDAASNQVGGGGHGPGRMRQHAVAAGPERGVCGLGGARSGRRDRPAQRRRDDRFGDAVLLQFTQRRRARRDTGSDDHARAAAVLPPARPHRAGGPEGAADPFPGQPAARVERPLGAVWRWRLQRRVDHRPGFAACGTLRPARAAGAWLRDLRHRLGPPERARRAGAGVRG